MFDEKEILIKKKRLGEAITRNYFGLDGKFGIILKYLGVPILDQEAKNYDVREFPDVYEIQDEDVLPLADLNNQTKKIGTFFDGLNRGQHIEIKYLDYGVIPIRMSEYRTVYEEVEKILTVYYKGYLVYREVENDLQVFIPGDWEAIIEKIYKSAEKIQKSYKQELPKIKKTELEDEKKSFFDRIKEMWGV